MSRILSIVQGAPITLEDIWKQAESIGRIKIEREYNNPVYKIEIHFKNSTGSTIWATAHNADIGTGLMMAINEARRLY